ncbi:MAG: GAF domain-containing protein, partial [Nitrospirae bacterium]|nr:GAF domain-containing protein [Nitrospirota bacterium]
MSEESAQPSQDSPRQDPPGIEAPSLDILSEISRIANSTLDLKARLDTIVTVTAERMGKDAAAVCLLDKEERHLILKAARGLLPEAVDRVILKVGEGVNGWVARERRPLALADAQSDPRFKYFPVTGEERYRSMLAVPILVQDHCIGVLSVRTLSVWEYSPDEITLLTTIAANVGGIIRNAQLYQDVNQRLLELTALYDIGQALTSTLDLETVLRMIIKNSIAVLKARGGVLRFLDPDTQMLIVKACSVPEVDARKLVPLRIGEGISGRIVQTGAPLLIAQMEESDLRGVSAIAFSSVLGVPIQAKDRIIGTITLYDKTLEPGLPSEAFTQEDEQLLSTLASQAAIAIENAKLYQQTLKSAKEIETLYSLSKGMTSVLDLYFVLDSVLRMIGETLEGEYGILTLFEEETRELAVRSLWGGDADLAKQLRFQLGEGTTGRIALQRESLLLDQIPPEDKKLS